MTRYTERYGWHGEPLEPHEVREPKSGRCEIRRVDHARTLCDTGVIRSRDDLTVTVRSDDGEVRTWPLLAYVVLPG